MNLRIFHRRTPALNLRVFERRGGDCLGRICDLSQGGLQIFGERPLQIGILYELDVELPATDGVARRLPLRGKAMWTGPDHNPDFQCTGLRLFDLDDSECQSALTQLLALYTVNLAEDDMADED